MKIIEGSILDVEEGHILHCVNCQNVMGSGVARALYQKWPIVKEQYHLFCENKKPLQLLNCWDAVPVTNKVVVVNCFAQLTYGGPGRHADYGALKTILKGFKEDLRFCKDYSTQCYIPARMCSNLAGADWGTVMEIFDLYFPSTIAVQLSK